MGVFFGNRLVRSIPRSKGKLIRCKSLSDFGFADSTLGLRSAGRGRVRGRIPGDEERRSRRKSEKTKGGVTRRMGKGKRSAEEKLLLRRRGAP